MRRDEGTVMLKWEKIVCGLMIALMFSLSHYAFWKIGYQKGYTVAKVEVRKDLWCKWFKYIFPQSDLKKEDCN